METRERRDECAAQGQPMEALRDPGAWGASGEPPPAAWRAAGVLGPQRLLLHFWVLLSAQLVTGLKPIISTLLLSAWTGAAPPAGLDT